VTRVIPVLIVDDEPIVKMALRSSIPWERHGFALCATASSGEEALELVRTHRPRIVITDLKMPGMGGLELIRRLRSEGHACVVLVLSNYDDFDSVRTALVQGADDYMLKVNISAETLLAQLEKARRKIGDRPEDAPDALSPEAWRRAAAHCLTEDGEAPEGLSFPCTMAFLSFFTEKSVDSALIANNALETLEEFPEARLVPLGERTLALLTAAPPDALLQKLDARFETYQSLHATVDVEANVRTLLEARILCRRERDFAARFHVEHREVAQVVRWIDRNLSRRLQLEDLARRVNLSVSYLCRIFKQETGLSVTGYLNERRMSRAAELLKGENLPVKAAALSVGIEDQLYFSRLFRKTYHLSPSAYRSKAREG
jgi:two-component system response regulator YesN